MAGNGYGYAVWRDKGWLSLIRYNKEGVWTFYGESARWERTPEKDNILSGGGDFVWYDEISEEEAKKVAVEIIKAYKAKNAK